MRTLEEEQHPGQGPQEEHVPKAARGTKGAASWGQEVERLCSLCGEISRRVAMQVGGGLTCPHQGIGDIAQGVSLGG